MLEKRATTIFLAVLAAVAAYLCYLIAQPFLSAIIAALVIAIVFFPLYARIHRLIRSRNTAAALSTLLVVVIVLVPALLLGVAVSKELTESYLSLSKQRGSQSSASSDFSQLLDRSLQVIGGYVDLSGFDARASLLRWLEQASQYLVTLGAAAVSNVFSLPSIWS